jgi:hypothetical protein
MISSHRIAAELMTGPHALRVLTAKITRDDSWAPYVQADLTCAAPDPDVMRELDPRGAPSRVRLTLTRVYGQPLTLGALSTAYPHPAPSTVTGLGPARIPALTNRFAGVWNVGPQPEEQRRDVVLWLRSRPRDLGAGTVTLTLTSGEVLLQDYRWMSSLPWRPPALDVRTIVGRVLARVGAYLQTADSFDQATVPPEAVEWAPGQSAWDYLTPLLQAAGRRLWCDELGKWHLAARDTPTGGAALVLGRDAITAAGDTIDRAGWYDSVLVRYRWKDEAGNDHERFDQATSAGSHRVQRPLVLEYESGYPGPGAARRILARQQVLGRGLTASLVSDYSIDPGQPITLELTDEPRLAGTVSRVLWSFPEDVMELETVGVVEPSPTSWRRLPPALRWADVPPGLTWANADQLIPAPTPPATWARLPSRLRWRDVDPSLTWANADQLIPTPTT